MRGIILILSAALLWGTTGTSQALAPAGASPLSIGAMRLLIGGGALLALATSRGHFRNRAGWRQPATLIAGMSTAVYQLAFFAGVALTGISVGTITAIGSAPIFAGLLGRIFFDERIRPRWILSTVLAILGGGFLAFSGNETMNIHPFGLLLSLIAGLSYAVFTAANKHLIALHSADATMAVSFSLGAIFLLPIFFVEDFSWVLTGGGIAISLHLGLLATGLAYMLYGRGLKTVSVGSAGTLALLEPLTATLLGVLLIGEYLTTQATVGIACIFIGLMLLVTEQ